MQACTRTAAVIGSMALAVGLLLAGCGSSTTAEDPGAAVTVSWTCTREGDTVTCTCEGAEAACADSVAEPSQVKGVTSGRVTFFDNAKGFGFITPDGGGTDLFVHFKDLQMEGFKKLGEGQRVSFDVTKGSKGPQAINVRVTDE